MKNDAKTEGDSGVPKRGAIPTPRSEIENAQSYVPDSERIDDQEDRQQGE